MARDSGTKLRDGAFLLVGDCVEVLARVRESSIDAIVTDPPYGLEFMGKGWDTMGYGNAQQAWHVRWLAEALRILKPGGHLVAFGGTRTFHRLVCAAEDVGFEIRDMLTWHYGQGFPKSHKLGDGWGTALKPATEPILLARKPLVGTVAANVQKHGTGALNIDATRIGTTDTVTNHARGAEAATSKGAYGSSAAQETHQTAGQILGRWPANVVLSHAEECRPIGAQAVRRDLRDATGAGAKVQDNEHDGGGAWKSSGMSLGSTQEMIEVWECVEGCPVRVLDEQTGTLTSGKATIGAGAGKTDGKGVYGKGQSGVVASVYADSGGASRFFYTSKASNGERWGYCHDCAVAFCRGDKPAREAHTKHKVEWHPTVKPVEIMAWLIKLVVPPGGTLLDPFAGTGTTAAAASVVGGLRTVLIERESTAAGGHPYVEIIRARFA